MPRRQHLLGRCITRAILSVERASSAPLLARIISFFSILQLRLVKLREAVFAGLREEVWQYDDEEYKTSFAVAHRDGGLKSVGDMGYSGSVFFATPDDKFLVKSLQRSFEYTHFENDMLGPFVQHMRDNPNSLLVRITDFLYSPQATMGVLFGITPSRFMVMENVLHGKDKDAKGDAWETYDLKPIDYFYPERDVAEGKLVSEATKDRLVDRFEDKLRITRTQLADLKSVLESDTALLASTNTVDYSLFLVRYPADLNVDPVAERASGWRKGLTSRDGRWKYRVVLLDFFWAKHKFQARLMTTLVNTFNIFARKGPMSVTTTPEEYRGRFLEMIGDISEVVEDEE